MKKILVIATCLLASTISFSQLIKKSAYPQQSVEKREDVPKVITFIATMPLVKQVGDMKYIHDIYNNAFILFKGQDDTLLTKLMDHLAAPATGMDANNKEFSLTPIGVFTETPIAPFTLFTKKELKRQSKEDQEKLIELAKYKTYSITVPDYTYKEFLTPNELALLTGKTQQQQPQQVIKNVPLQQPNTQKNTHQSVIDRTFGRSQSY